VPFDEHGRFGAIAPDGKTVAIEEPDAGVRVHDTADGTIVRELKIADKQINGIVYSPDSRYLEVSSKIGQCPEDLTIWDLRTGKTVRNFQSAQGYVNSVAFAPDGRHLILASQFHELRLVDFLSGKEVRRLGRGPYHAAVFSPDGKTLAAMSDSGTIQTWDPWTGRALPASADPMTGLIADLAFGNDGKELRGTGCVPNGADFVRIAWDSATGREIRRYGKLDDSPVLPRISPDEKLLAVGQEDGRIDLYGAETGNRMPPLTGHGKRVWQVVFAPDSRRLISHGADGTIRQWDLATGRDVLQLPAPDSARPMKLSSDGRWLAVVDEPQSHISVWDLSTGREKSRFELPIGSRTRVTLFVDEHVLIAASRFDDVDEIRRWEVDTGRERAVVAVSGTEVQWGDFSPDGRTVAVFAEGSLRVLEVASGGRRREFVGHELNVSSFAFSRDGRRLAAASQNSPVYVWDVPGSVSEMETTSKAIDRCWADLADSDGAVAFRAICRLAAVPDAGVRLLRDRVKPSAPLDPKEVARLIQGLDNDSFAERQKSADGLKRLGDTAADALRKARANATSAEVRRQLDDILERPAADTPETLRSVRAVEALESMATPAAATLLDELAHGLAGTRLTREASIARERLRRR
jgi:WD40 repeat protein